MNVNRTAQVPEHRPEMSEYEFGLLADFFAATIGFHLTKDKLYLLASRLENILIREKIPSFSELYVLLKSGVQPDLLSKVVDAVTINETYFFRDTRSFTDFQNIILPHIKQNAGSRNLISAWSCASSTGQEPYSFAISLADSRVLDSKFNYDFLATDIAQRVLSIAEAGIYSQLDVQRGLPVLALARHFTQTADMRWQVKPEIQQMIKFAKHNLLHELPMQKQFDLILCRNVLIYFDEKTKAIILQKLAKKLCDGGVLLIAATEHLAGLDVPLKPFMGVPGAYQKV